jgi:hypothetical protein
MSDYDMSVNQSQGSGEGYGSKKAKLKRFGSRIFSGAKSTGLAIQKHRPAIERGMTSLFGPRDSSGFDGGNPFGGNPFGGTPTRRRHKVIHHRKPAHRKSHRHYREVITRYY